MNDEIKRDMKQEKEGPDSGFPLHAVYFYYMLYDTGGNYTIRAYRWDSNTPGRDLRDLCVRMADNAIRDGSDFGEKGTKFDDIVRKRKGYFVIALDGAAFKSPNPVSFYCDDASVPDSKGNDGKHTFQPHGGFTETVRGKPISFVIYKSHSQSHKDKDNLNDGEYEHFMIKFEGTLAAQLAAAPPYIYDDSGGTNMGPPPPPPLAPDV